MQDSTFSFLVQFNALGNKGKLIIERYDQYTLDPDSEVPIMGGKLVAYLPVNLGHTGEVVFNCKDWGFAAPNTYGALKTFLLKFMVERLSIVEPAAEDYYEVIVEAIERQVKAAYFDPSLN